MTSATDYIFQHRGNQKEILLFFHDWFTNELKLTSKIRYKIPFYDKNSWICYLNSIKGGKIELAFIRGRELSNSQGLLQFKKRKQIAGIEFETLDEVPFGALREIMEEAISLDKQMPYRGPLAQST